MNDKPVCEIPKNSRESYKFTLAEYKGHKFCDLRLFVKGEGEEAIRTQKGLTVSPALWPEFRAALDQIEAAMVQEGWLDREDLEAQG